MSETQADRMIDLRIACPEAGYPLCEARYDSIEDYEQQTGCKFWLDKPPEM